MSSTLIFIDWDDTLFPTHWIKSTDIDLKKNSETLIAIFSELDSLITNLISKIVNLGNLLIVTNGSESWIKRCTSILPKFSILIESEKISITSARDLFQDEHPTNEWKDITFKMHFNEHISKREGVYHILSFGDSHYEHDSVTKLKDFNSVPNQNRFVKSVRFIKHPSLNQLVTQLELVEILHEDIIHSRSDAIYNLAEFIAF